ncbi:MAG: hypothetical protein WAP47_18710 [Candidatus Rokuibacteriota bacterium]
MPTAASSAPAIPAVKAYRETVGILSLPGLFILLRWLLQFANVSLSIDNQGHGRPFGLINLPGTIENTFLNLEIRILGQTVLDGYWQVV